MNSTTTLPGGAHGGNVPVTFWAVGDLTAGDFLEVELEQNGGAVTIVAGATFIVFKLQGVKGEKGDAGSGSTIVVEEEGTPIAGGPHDTLNFIGSGVTASDAGGGTADITVTGGGASGDQAMVQARRTTTFSISTSFTDVTLDTTDEENDAAVLEHDNTNTDRLTFKETGAHWVWYKADINPPSVGDTMEIQGRVTVNDGGAALPGSDGQTTVFSDSSIGGDDVTNSLMVGFVYDATANDFLTLQLQKVNVSGTSSPDTRAGGVTFGAIRLQGTKGDTGATGPAGSTVAPIQLFADMFENPVNSDWAVNALAPASADTNNNGLTVRRFDDTTEEGVGATVFIPSGVTNIIFRFRSRAETAPGAAATVGVQVYEREMPDNGAVTAWSAGTQLTDIDIPTNENFQYDEQTLTLASLGLTAGNVHQFEWTRVNPTGGTELTGDWTLLAIEIDFS